MARRAYPVDSPRQGWAQTAPASWERAAREAVAELVAAAPDVEVVAIGLDGQMHGTVLVDEHGAPVRDAVLWPDNRAGGQLPRWRELPAGLRAGLANPLTAGMPGPVLGWLAEHEPDVVARATAFVLPKDWLRSRLVPAKPCTDPSDASASLLWDVLADTWAVEVAGLVGVPPRLLPGLRRSEEPVGTLGAAAARWGLPAGTPVGVGCGDVAATLLGLGAEPGRTVLTVGTGAQLVLPGVTPGHGVTLGAAGTDQVRHHLYRDSQSGWFAMGAVLNAGLALAHVVELLSVGWDELYRAYDPSAELPVFVPHFAAERLPEVAEAGGAGWFDIGLATSRADLLAAALEGVAFGIRRCFEAMPCSAEVIDLGGGGSRSPVFSQLLSDVLHRPLRLHDQRDATVVGAARLGWHAAGDRPVVRRDETQQLVEPRRHDAIEERYERFLRRVGDD